MKTFRQVFKWLTLSFFGITIISMTFGQVIPIEFADWEYSHLYYDIIFRGLPIGVLLTLVWTIKIDKPKRRNILLGILTPLFAFAVYFGSFFLMFLYGFGAWTDEQVIFTNNENPKITINKQLWDIGAFGYGGQRTVKLIPFLGLWNITKEVDLNEIDRSKWTIVQREEELKSE